MIITKNGVRVINEKIESIRKKLKDIRDEKTVAYESTGDTWHDNPYFNKLEQEEKAENLNIQKLESVLRTAEIIEWTERNTEVVEIGSIIHCICEYSDFEDEVVYEIVGYGESDFENGKISYDTPVGSQLIGVKLGEEKIIESPGGDARYKVIKMYKDWNEVDI